MRDRGLYEKILGLPAPWHVEDVELREDAREVIVTVGLRRPLESACPDCGEAMDGYDHRRRSWRRLDTCQYKTITCSRVENEAFVELAEDVRELSRYAESHALTIAVMGCRVNGPGETDDADLGLWCGPTHVNLKRGPELVGAYSYAEILPRLRAELDALIAARTG